MEALNFDEKTIIKADELPEGIRFPIIAIHETLPAKESSKSYTFLELNNVETDESIYVWAPLRAKQALNQPQGDKWLKHCDYTYIGVSPNGYPKILIREQPQIVSPPPPVKSVKRKKKSPVEVDITNEPVLVTQDFEGINNIIADAMASADLEAPISN